MQPSINQPIKIEGITAGALLFLKLKTAAMIFPIPKTKMTIIPGINQLSKGNEDDNS